MTTLLERNAVDADACVVGETTCSGGHRSVTVADRGSIWLTLRAAGTAAHGSRPMLGNNAIDRLWEALTTLRTRLSDRELSLPDEFARILEESVTYYEPTLGETAARNRFEYPSVNLGVMEGGSKINAVPSETTARLDIRLTAGVETSDTLADIRDCLSAYPAVSIADVSWSVGTYEPTDGPIVEAVTTAVEATVDERVYRRSASGGDAKKFRSAGIPTVEFAFGTDTAHAVDEYTTVDALGRNAGVYAQLPEIWNALAE